MHCVREGVDKLLLKARDAKIGKGGVDGSMPEPRLRSAGMILFLGSFESQIYQFLKQVQPVVVHTEHPITLDHLNTLRPSFIVSHGYRHKVKPDVIAAYKDKIINLHISYLPWNRGADPNFWSWIERSPKGVTIHYMDEGLDTGDIIVQRKVELDDSNTLATSYEKLQNALLELFKDNWWDIKLRVAPRTKQPPGGSYHRSDDKKALMHLLVQGWNTPVNVLTAHTSRNRIQFSCLPTSYEVAANDLHSRMDIPTHSHGKPGHPTYLLPDTPLNHILPDI